MRFRLLLTFLLCHLSMSNAFRSTFMRTRSESCLASSVASPLTREDTHSDNPMRLTPELLKIVNAFERIGDTNLRYKQLLYMGTQLTPLEPSRAIPENKVPGCLNTVYVDCVPVDEGDGRLQIKFVGDSDGLLTKGLVALLIRSLSGNTSEDIQKVDPAFILKVCDKASLTPGRSNGFLNMLNVMKRKAQELEASYQVARAGDHEGESFLSMEAAASAFEGLNLLNRQQLESKSRLPRMSAKVREEV